MIAEWPVARLFDVDDFMIMGGWRRNGKPLLYLYKHGFTRRYLNIDADGEAWRYVEPKRLDSNHPGRFIRLPSLESAVNSLGLWEMPWMDPDRFGHLRDSCSGDASHM